MSINEKEFYKRSAWDKILDYKKSIFAILATILGATVLYLFFAEKTYTTEAIVEVSPKLNKLNNSIQLQGGESVFFRHLQTQIDFIQSRTLMEKVINKLYANIYYYEKKGFKYHRIVKDLPYEIKYIKIKDPAFYKQMFSLKPLQDGSYELKLVSNAKNKPLIYRFSKLFKSKYFDIAIERNKAEERREIFFKVFDEKAYIDQVLQHLSVLQNSDKSSMIRIVYTDTNPYSAKYFVDALLEEFLHINMKNEISEAEDLLTLVSGKLEEEKKKLDASEKLLKAYIKDHRVAGLDTQTNQIISTIYLYEKKLETLKIKYHKLTSIEKIYKKNYDYKSIITLVQEIDNQSLIGLINSIVTDETAYKTLRLKYTDKHPDVQKIRRTIGQKLKILAQNIAELKKNSLTQISEIKGYLKHYKKDLTNVPQREFGYAKLKRTHDLLEKHYLFLLDKKTQIIISKQVEGAYEYRIIDNAYVPAFASTPKKKVLMLLALLLGMILGILYALLRDYFSKYIKAPSEVEELTNLPYFSTIPYIKDKTLYNDLFVIKAPRLFASEMVWSLRTTIEDSVKKDSDKGLLIAVTSIIKGEGKTTIAANLALSLGLGDKKTVVVAMDTRLPELHLKFGLDNRMGITSVLFGNKNLEAVTFRPRNLKNFAVIPSGTELSNPLKIINSNKIEEVLSQLREKYDYIVLDLPPIGVAAEAIFLMKKADLVISVLKANYSEKNFVTYTENIAIKHNIKNIGFVLNGVDNKYIKVLSRKENLKYIKSHAYISGEKHKKKMFDFLKVFK